MKIKLKPQTTADAAPSRRGRKPGTTVPAPSPRVGATVRVNEHNGWITRVIETIETLDPETGYTFDVKLRSPLYEVLVDLASHHPHHGPAKVYLPVRRGRYQAVRVRLFADEFEVLAGRQQCRLPLAA